MLLYQKESNYPLHCTSRPSVRGNGLTVLITALNLMGCFSNPRRGKEPKSLIFHEASLSV